MRREHSGDMRTLSLEIGSIQRLAPRHEHPVPPPTTETNVAADLRQQDLADPRAVWGENMHAVVTVSHPACAGPDVAVGVGPDAVGHAGDLLLAQVHLHRHEFFPFAELHAIDN